MLFPAFPRPWPSLVLAGLCAVVPLAGAQGDDPLAAARAEFRSAYAQPLQRGTDSPSLQAYPLYPYLQAARLRAQLAAAGPALAGGLDGAVAADLSATDDALATRDLRRDWLLSLGRRKQWDLFLAQYQDGVATPELRCDQFAARIALDRTKGLTPEITQVWLTGQALPPACDGVFDWLRASEGLPPSLVDQRARLTLQAGDARLARSLLAGLPPGLAGPLRQWATLVETPRMELEALAAAPARPVEPAALIDGWNRLSRSDPDAAAALYEPLMQARHLDAPADRAPFVRAVGLGFAWNRRNEAGGWLSRLGPDLVADDTLREWKIRAALWSGDWPAAQQAVLDLPPAYLNAQPRWQYWLARAEEKTGRTEDARKLYAQVALGDAYYAALASARLGQAYAPHPDPIALDGAQQARLAVLPGFVRARELWWSGLEPQAGAEWLAALDGIDGAQRVQAIGLASRWGWYGQAVATASKQGLFNDYELLYPRPYDAPVRTAATANGLPEELVYAIIRQESLYDALAVSHANALGLMQLLLPTARQIAHRAALPPPSHDSLFDPATNIALGAAELRGGLDRFGGQWPPAIAAYNAGPGAAARWLPPAPMDADVWIENIPYNETRTYVQRVLWHSAVFDWLRGGEPVVESAWLSPVSSGAVAPAGDPPDRLPAPAADPPAAGAP